MPAVPLESRLLQALAPWREAGLVRGVFRRAGFHGVAASARPTGPERSLAGAVGAACPPWLAGCGGRLAGALPGGLPVAGYPARVERVQVAVGGSIAAGGARRPLSRIPGEPGRGTGAAHRAAPRRPGRDPAVPPVAWSGPARPGGDAGEPAAAAAACADPCSGFPRRTGSLCADAPAGLGGGSFQPGSALRATTCAGRSCRVSPPTGRRPSPAWRCAAHLREAEDPLAELAAIDLRPAANPRNWIGRTGWICPGSPWSLCAASALRASATCCGHGWGS